jgi:hypothetical protein
MTSRREIAIHEAGHIVVARLLGVPIRSATMEPPQIITANRSGKLALRHDVLVDLSGPLASGSGEAIDHVNALWRCRKIVAIEKRAPKPAEAARLRRNLAAIARRLVRENAPAIKKVALALDAKGELSQGEIDALIAEAAG